MKKLIIYCLLIMFVFILKLDNINADFYVNEDMGLGESSGECNTGICASTVYGYYGIRVGLYEMNQSGSLKRCDDTAECSKLVSITNKTFSFKEPINCSGTPIGDLNFNWKCYFENGSFDEVELKKILQVANYDKIPNISKYYMRVEPIVKIKYTFHSIKPVFSGPLQSLVSSWWKYEDYKVSDADKKNAYSYARAFLEDDPNNGVYDGYAIGGDWNVLRSYYLTFKMKTPVKPYEKDYTDDQLKSMSAKNFSDEFSKNMYGKILIRISDYIKEPTCESDFESLSNKNSMAERVRLYVKWGKNGLLNTANATSATACQKYTCDNSLTAGCFVGNVNSSFNKDNLSCYNDIYVSSTGKTIGLCKTDFTIDNSYLNFSSKSGIDFSSKSGQLLFVGKDFAKSTAAKVNLNKRCFLFKANENYSLYTSDKNLSDNINIYSKSASSTDSYLNFSIKDNNNKLNSDYTALGESYDKNKTKTLTLKKDNNNYYKANATFYLNFPMAIANKSDGSFVEYFKVLGDSEREKFISIDDGLNYSFYDFENKINEFCNVGINKLCEVNKKTVHYNFIGYGIPSRLNLGKEKIEGSLNFDIVLNTRKFKKDDTTKKYTSISSLQNKSTGVCKYEIENEIIDCPSGDCDDPSGLNLEFRIIDTKKPFPGKSGNDRIVGSNWCFEDNCNNNNDTVIDEIINANNSFNKTKEGAKYIIELTPSDIRDIRSYNKNNSYDDYTLKIKSNGKITSDFLEKSYINLEI